MQDLSVRISASGSCRPSCARSLYVDLLCKISLSGSLHQDPVGPLCKISVCGSLVQDLSGMMSAPGSCRTSCARSLYVDLLCKISLSGSLHQDPVGPLVKISGCGSLVQDLSVMMSASGSCRTSCTRSLYEDLLCKVSVSRSPQLEYLCRISVCGSLVQDLSGMMSASGSSRISCARSLYGDLLCKISLSGCLHQDSVGPLVQDLCMKSEIATLPAFRAMDTHDLRRGLHFEIRNRNFTRIPRT